MSNTKNETARKAASWWACQLRNPTLGNFNMGENSQIGGFAMMAGFILANQTIPNEAKIKNFEIILEQKILKELETHAAIAIMTDYGPVSNVLTEALLSANIDTQCIPWKTYMWIDANGKISVSTGYNSTPKEI